MKKTLNYKKLTIHTLFIVAIILLATVSLQAGFAATHNINNSTTVGGINSTLTGATAGDTIILDEGTYTGNNNNTNITINKNIIITGKTKDKLILDAQGLSRIFVIGNNLNVTFINITFLNGESRSNGGAVYANETMSGMFVNCTFINNTGHIGGALGNFLNATVINSNFINNTARSGGTGGGAAVYAKRYLFVLNSNFTDNKAISGAGGAIFSEVRTYIINCSFTNNTANSSSLGGGAIFINGPHPSSYTFIANSSFIKNVNHGSGGGAFYSNAANSNVVNCNFINNKGTLGGSLYATSNSINFSVISSNFTKNNADNGGAIYINSNSSNIVGSLFTNNSAINGGGIFTTSRSGTSYPYVTNCTFIENNADYGGTIFNNANMIVSGNVMRDNSAVLGQMIYNNGTMGVLNLTFINNQSYIVRNGSTITIYATLTDDMGNTVTGQNISFYLNGILYENIESIEGIASFNYTVNGLTGDLIPVNGSYAGIGNYDIIIKEGLLTIKISTNSTINAENTVVGKPTTIKGIASDEDGNILANTVLTLTINGKDYIVTTNDAGEWSLNYMPINSGNINVAIQWSGNTTHSGFINSTNFNVIQERIDPGKGNDTPNPDPTPTPIPEPVPTPNPNPNSNNITKKPSNNPAANAAMENTGMPMITIILVLFSLFGVIISRKKGENE